MYVLFNYLLILKERVIRGFYMIKREFSRISEKYHKTEIKEVLDKDYNIFISNKDNIPAEKKHGEIAGLSVIHLR